MISLNAITLTFGSFTLLDQVSLHIGDKEKIGLVGKNGAGKSTILKMIVGMQSPTSGQVMITTGQKIGYLPQIMEHSKGRTVIEETMTVFDSLKAQKPASLKGTYVKSIFITTSHTRMSPFCTCWPPLFSVTNL